MRVLLVGLVGVAAMSMAGAASAEPSFDFTRANQVTATAADVEVAWSGNGKQSRGEIRLAEDSAVAHFRVVNAVQWCTRDAGEHGGLACNAEVRNLKPGKTYYFRLAVIWHGADGEHVTLGPVASFATPAVEKRTPPQVSYQSVTGYAESWAKFNYLVDGFNRSYETWVQCQAAGVPAVQSSKQGMRARMGQVNIYAQVNGLKPSTAYTCTITAVSDFGTGTATIGVKTDSP